MKTKGKNKFIRFRDELTQESFTDFFDCYFPRLTKFALTIVKTELLAEEAVIDVFMKIWEQRLKLSTINNIETFLFVSVRNASVNMLRNEKKFHFDMLQDSNIQLAEYKPSADKLLIESEIFEELNNAVRRLPPKCKIIFKLIREDGLNRNEVANILNVSVKTIDNQIAIAVKKIAEQLHIDLSNPQNSKRLFTVLLTL